jgi:hypothetical protein
MAIIFGVNMVITCEESEAYIKNFFIVYLILFFPNLIYFYTPKIADFHFEHLFTLIRVMDCVAVLVTSVYHIVIALKLDSC